MADDATSSSHEKQGQLDPPIPAKKNARKKIRPTYSCLNCHKRKVKVVLLSRYNMLLLRCQEWPSIVARFRLANQLTMVGSVIG